jgi:hypothetical protein
MTKDEIYEHLAKVYLGKKKKKKKQKNLKFYTLLFINVVTLPVIIGLIVGAVNYHSLAGKAKPNSSLQLALNYYPLRINYDFRQDRPQVMDFALNLPESDISKYSHLEFSLKGGKKSYPAKLKITLENRRREKSSYYLSDITTSWQKVSIPLSEFKEITDLSNLTKISFVLEAWNLNNKTGSILVEDIGFATHRTLNPAKDSSL